LVVSFRVLILQGGQERLGGRTGGGSEERMGKVYKNRKREKWALEQKSGSKKKSRRSDLGGRTMDIGGLVNFQGVFLQKRKGEVRMKKKAMRRKSFHGEILRKGTCKTLFRSKFSSNEAKQKTQKSGVPTESARPRADGP